MRIAIDAREATGHSTGVGRYLSALLAAWHDAGVDRQHELHLYAPVAPSLVPANLAATTHRVAGHGGTRWEQWDYARALARTRPDVVFAPGYTAPLSAPAPTVVAIHDVSFFAHPEWYSWREGTRRRLVTAWSARRARLVLAPSAFSAAEIVRHTAVPQERVRLIYLGVAPPPRRREVARAPLVLFVGSLFQRRRLDVVIEAFARLATTHPEARLEIVGENRTEPRIDMAALLAARGLAGRARVRDWVDEATLAGLYAEASAFVFLSRYEGFGFTPLEAMANGVVPVVLDTPVSREIYGAAAWRVAEGEGVVGEVTTALATLLDDGPRAAELRAAAAPVLASYRWDDTARRVVACLEEAALG